MAAALRAGTAQQQALRTPMSSNVVAGQQRSRASVRAKDVLNPMTMGLTAGCLALVKTGAVPPQDVAFSIAWPAYIFGSNWLRFRNNASMQGRPPGPLVTDAWVKTYAAGAGVLALIIPAAVCIIQRDNPAVLQAVGPHLFLTSTQVICEYLTSGANVAMLPRMLVPIGFNTYRMWTLVTWCSAILPAGLGPWHQALAVLNLLFWAYNLFGFLLLNMVPRYLDAQKCAT
eukprot:GHRR01004618.1.p1 GENE.GHRR01004618.1~~GHRR01004618.1.p1  ORF type:complete len:229 (+),score=48.65 GHRR01004618.1:229-915(+)